VIVTEGIDPACSAQSSKLIGSVLIQGAVAERAKVSVVRVPLADVAEL
jgi:hypothetical protein